MDAMQHNSHPPAVEVQDLVVRYRTNVDRNPSLRRQVATMGRRRMSREITALDGVSLTVPRGGVLGVIGANGAGKTTLLRTMAGILPPASGRVVVRGEVTTLLSLGVGFNKTLSGRENIYLGGLASGSSVKEVEEKVEAIVEFAELEEWIDMPVDTYSSGMYSRLAFSVAVHMDPDILLIDESLATGDASFRDKASNRMKEMVKGAGAIVLVSHALRFVTELADQAVWLHKGKIRQQGRPEEVIGGYQSFSKAKRATAARSSDVS
jgi:ABC-type polysaccharide/polyol phosphate transport system ATPase subunit